MVLDCQSDARPCGTRGGLMGVGVLCDRSWPYKDGPSFFFFESHLIGCLHGMVFCGRAKWFDLLIGWVSLMVVLVGS